MLQVFIPTTRFPHIKRIFAVLGKSRRVIAVVINYTPEDGVPIISRTAVRGHDFPMETKPRTGYKKRIQTHPIPLYISTATLFPALTYRSTNHASLLSETRSSASVSRRAWPSRLQAGATVRTVMCPCQGV